ncbi:hypothetical protein LTR12_001552 [Friedmanniomyces endolithicus]|nr:hypothetical protein LTR74_002186 [Friedmanniomyces endolithicus]KAK1824019.1 hypothetical protein LTR12_001552 [Friedmanniomyces endolithicus]
MAWERMSKNLSFWFVRSHCLLAKLSQKYKTCERSIDNTRSTHSERDSKQLTLKKDTERPSAEHVHYRTTNPKHPHEPSTMSAKDGKLLKDYDVLYPDQTIEAEREAARRKANKNKPPATLTPTKKPEPIFLDPKIPNNDIPADVVHMITAMQAMEAAYQATAWRIGDPEFRADCTRMDDWTKTLKGILPGVVTAPNFTELPAKGAGKEEVHAFVVGRIKEAVGELKAGGRHALAEELQREFPNHVAKSCVVA